MTSAANTKIVLWALVLWALVIWAGLSGCGEEENPFIGDPDAYQPQTDRTAQPLLCSETDVAVFNNVSSPFRWGEEQVQVQVDIAADFLCPACIEFALFTEALWEGREDFRKFVRIYFHHMPLESIHPGTTEIHVVTAAAAEQGYGHFWALHDQIFEVSALGRTITMDGVEAFLEGRSGFEMEKFHEDMRSDAVKDFVQWDVRQGVLAGVTGTPSVFICGRKLYDAPGFEQAVDEALNQ